MSEIPQHLNRRRCLVPADFERLEDRQALTAAYDLMSAELLVCRDQDEYLSLIKHRKCIKRMRQRLEKED